MVEQRIIYTNAEGVLIIITPAYNDLSRSKDDTDEVLVQRNIAESIPLGIPYRIISLDVYMLKVVACSGRVFRDAWEDPGTGIKVNMAKAGTIHMARIRGSRDKAIAALDAPWMIAMEAWDQVLAGQIAAQKQVLRDIPQKYDLSGFKTPEELKAFWPKELDERIKDVQKAF